MKESGLLDQAYAKREREREREKQTKTSTTWNIIKYNQTHFETKQTNKQIQKHK